MCLNRVLSFYTIILFFCMIFAAICHANTDHRIGLQNLETRTVVYCYSNAQLSAEDCAQHYESQGYTRLRDIPYKTARYDFLTVDTYPTRRWRNGELTPRW